MTSYTFLHYASLHHSIEKRGWIGLGVCHMRFWNHITLHMPHSRDSTWETLTMVEAFDFRMEWTYWAKWCHVSVLISRWDGKKKERKKGQNKAVTDMMILMLFLKSLHDSYQGDNKVTNLSPTLVSLLSTCFQNR